MAHVVQADVLEPGAANKGGEKRGEGVRGPNTAIVSGEHKVVVLIGWSESEAGRDLLCSMCTERLNDKRRQSHGPTTTRGFWLFETNAGLRLFQRGGNYKCGPIEIDAMPLQREQLPASEARRYRGHHWKVKVRTG